MRWTDINDIVIELEETYPDSDILGLRFTQLKQMVLDLDRFTDDPKRSNEKILESIQMAWLKERE